MEAIELMLAAVMLLLGPAGLGYLIVGVWRRDRRKKWIGIACLGLVFLLWWRMGHTEFWFVDRCLDAGGRYDYQESVCEFE